MELMGNLINSIFRTEKSDDILLHLKCLDDLELRNSQNITSDLIDVNILDEIKSLLDGGNIDIYFGKNLQDIKIVMEDDNLRKHKICVQYKAPKKILISTVELPHSSMKNLEYECLGDIVETFRQNLNDLARYFYELDNIDHCCTVMEPSNKSFKDDYRRIYLDDRTWLHIEVTPEGLATNIHLVGQSEHWHNKLQIGLLNWDHDKNIVDNVMIIFDLHQFPQPANKLFDNNSNLHTDDNSADTVICGICLCADLSDTPGLPLPLCQSKTCGVYYHRTCLFQWLVACAGSRPPAFGVANGACPTCLQPITCTEKDN